MKRKRTYLLLLLSSLLSTLSLGQQPADSISWSIDLADVVVTAQYAPTDSRNALQDIQVIKRETIERRGANNLEQLLQQEPTIRISQDLVLGSSLSLAGISGQNVKILLDGVPIIGRQGGNIDLSQINLQNIERIEIVQGPLGVSYGTDALAGVIHLISKKSQLKPLSIGLNTQWESRAERTLGGQIGWQVADRLLLQLQGGWDVFNGFSEDTTRSVLWNPKAQWYATASLGYRLGPEKQLRYTLNYFDERVDNLGNIRRPQFKPYAFDDRYQTYRLDHTLSFDGEVGNQYYVQAVAGINAFTRHKNTFRNNFEEETLTEELGLQDTSLFNSYMLRATWASRYTDSPLNFQMGVDLRYDNASGERIQDSDSKQAGYSELGDYALFGTLRYQYNPSLSIESGLRYAYNTKYKSPLIPSLNLKYTWHKDWMLRASYGQGFRSPAIKELFFEFVDVNHYIIGNPELKAETSENVQLSIAYQRKREGQQSKIKVNGFYNHIKDKIELFEFVDTPSGPVPATDTATLRFAYFNQAVYKTQGLQAQISHQRKSFHIQTSLAIVGYYNPMSEIFSNLAPFSYTYEWNSEWRYRFTKPALQASAFLRYNDRRITFYPELDAEGNTMARQSIQQGFWMMDASLQWSIWQERIKLTTGARNILNVQSVQQNNGNGSTHSGDGNTFPVSPGRSFFVRMNFIFSH